MTSPLDEALALPGAVLTEAKRVFGETAELVYGKGYARAAVRLEADSDEIAVFAEADDALKRLLLCLKALPAREAP